MSRPTDAHPTPAGNSSGSSSRSREDDPQWRKYIDSPGLVLASCFFVFAIFGLPLIFMCRKFSPAMKVFWSVVVTLYTLLLFACFGAVLYWCYLQISSVQFI